MISETHSFSVAAAKKIGLRHALILGHIEYWCSENAMMNRHFHDGKYWTYASGSYLAKKYPYISVSAIKRILKKLEDDGLIVSGNYNQNKHDRTKWYAMTEEGMAVMRLTMDDLERETEERRSADADASQPDQPEFPVDSQEPEEIPEGAEEKPERAEEKPDPSAVAEEAVSYLNERTGKRFNPRIKKTMTLVTARLREGFTPADFKAVLDRKATDWGRDPKMRKYLRPETLFGTKFEGYLNEGVVAHDDDGWDKGW